MCIYIYTSTSHCMHTDYCYSNNDTYRSLLLCMMYSDYCYYNDSYDNIVLITIIIITIITTYMIITIIIITIVTILL